MYWILISIKYLLGLCIGLSAIRVSKKLPSHDRLTASEGVEPSSATRIKMLNRKFTLLSPPLQSYQPRFGFLKMAGFVYRSVSDTSVKKVT
ncbi:hypothetical protein P7633_45 [Streptococcus phage P7633]|uniref:Uncharacterized protein n=1 Tax=Streptococcus phage P7633 TaxID=1971435 RepID=A0A286QQH8_9CAUD|nr:hypothetical protein PP245_gp45 [Streptococcus phage P7633]ARU14183.1 hypothetical protein P7633_45 [Streptococcus phage P7633]